MQPVGDVSMVVVSKSRPNGLAKRFGGKNSLDMRSMLGGFVLCQLLATSALGQRPPSAACETNPACAALLEQAQLQSRQGSLVEAEKSYKMAYEVSHDARLLFNIARVLDKRGLDVEAITYYHRFIDAPLSNEEQKAKARSYLEPLEAKQLASIIVPTSPIETEPSPAANPSAEQSSKPLYKKAWFWGVMVGGVAAVGLGIGLGVGLSSRGPSVPSSTNLIDPTF